MYVVVAHTYIVRLIPTLYQCIISKLDLNGTFSTRTSEMRSD